VSSPNPTPLARYRLALLVAGILWSTGGFFIKWLSANPAWHASPLAITCYRALFAALALAPLLRGRKAPRLRDSLVAIVIYFLLLVLYVASNQGTSAANAIILQYTAPLWALALGPRFFGEPFQREDAVALSIAFAGMTVIFAGNFRDGQELALVMGAGSGLLFGLFLLWLRRLAHADPVAVTVVNNTGVALLAAVVLAFQHPAELLVLPRALSGEPALLAAVGVLALMGAVQIAAPYVLLSYGLRRVSGAEAGLIALVEPLLNPVWVVLLIGEQPTGSTLVGGALILAGLALRYTVFRGRAAAGGG